MRIKTAQSALLSNHEVLLHLQSELASYEGVGKKKKGRRMPPKDLQEILKDGIAYLTNPDYATHSIQAQHPNRPMTLYKGPNSLLRALAPHYRLNKTEYLQLYNTRPRSQATLQLVIEEANNRFTDAELDDILAIITHVFDEEEASIPAGVEVMRMEKLSDKMLGVTKGKKKKRAQV
ncbi:hypothetical protein P280DRAFT_524251 [Massarina eburnea CBS 473.64]|uniref:DNA-directed RNA polymerase III subunit RPC9 n=1 Tax=Massarina eburnea CBS 473.64 TaxID=1395130 RepID=A0A6A6RGF8_9PLEO|nr:hypothetical protein P280DRAFT_524251 [Massarina eburnea CBS 473.64]